MKSVPSIPLPGMQSPLNMGTRAARLPASRQLGGTLLGVVVGVLVGLGLALAVAMYVMKVPTPFNSKNTPRTSAQDEQEAKKNKDWDPNVALAGKPAPKVETPPEATEGSAPAAPAPASATSAPASTTTTQPITPATPAAKSADKTQALPDGAPTAAATTLPTTTAPAPATTVNAAPEFYVQVGAFRSLEEANALRAKLLLANFEGRIAERDQSGSKVYRVRVGPQPTQAASEKAKAALETAGFSGGIVVRTPIH